METNVIKDMIEQGLNGATASVTGDGSHFEAIVISEEFAGKSRLAQHRMVYATLGDGVENGTIHALSIRTFTPDQWQARSGDA